MPDESTLRRWAEELGFAQAALCAAAPFERAYRLVGMQAPLAERRQLRFFPQSDLPQIKSLAVLLWPYPPAAASEGEAVFIDSYYFASNAAYHAARRLEEQLLHAGCLARANVSYPAKEAAVRAGLGIIGKHSLLITPAYGTRVVIVLVATDIPPDGPDVRVGESRPSSCLGCGRCAAACPSGAITAQGMCHPEKCLRNFMMEGVVTPESLRRKTGMRLIGCDVCQRVCPMQPHAAPSVQAPLTLRELMTDDPQRFSHSVAQLAGQIGRNAARPQRVRAQAALLAGNSGNAAYLPILRAWARSPFEAVREHAVWAIGQIERANDGT